MAAITAVYESRIIQNYGGLKAIAFNCNSATAADTIDLSSVTFYKGTAAEVTAGDDKSIAPGISGSDIRSRFAQTSDDGVTVDLALAGDVLTLGSGPSSDEVEVEIHYRSY